FYIYERAIIERKLCRTEPALDRKRGEFLYWGGGDDFLLGPQNCRTFSSVFQQDQFATKNLSIAKNQAHL
ncbi:hypothetical protein, partial [Rothia sp. HMSC071F11]|uniref:hypothetical protein n=1 Tax=Rothia sp. HMSC071F11 TaxID=1715034 RepID=UPI001AF00C3E